MFRESKRSIDVTKITLCTQDKRFLKIFIFASTAPANFAQVVPILKACLLKEFPDPVRFHFRGGFSFLTLLR